MICELYNKMEKWYWENDYSDPKEEVGLLQFIGLLGAFPMLFVSKMVNKKLVIPINNKIKFRCSKVKEK